MHSVKGELGGMAVGGGGDFLRTESRCHQYLTSRAKLTHVLSAPVFFTSGLFVLVPRLCSVHYYEVVRVVQPGFQTQKWLLQS